MKDRHPDIAPLLRSLFGERFESLSEDERDDLTRAFLQAGRSAVLARLGSPDEAAEAVDSAKAVLGEACRRIAADSRVGDEEPLVASGWEDVQEALDSHRERLATIGIP